MAMTRRDLLGAVGMAAGTAAMYHAMVTLGHAQVSTYQGPIRLEGEPNGRRVLVLGAGLAFAFATSALAQEAQTEPANSDDAQTSDFRSFAPTEAEWEIFRSSGDSTHQGGETVYGAVCAGCHMPDGQGAVGAGAYPALADNELLAGPSYPVHLILEGQGAMPPLGVILDDQQIADVVNYIRSSFDNDFIEEFGDATADEVNATRPIEE